VTPSLNILRGISLTLFSPYRFEAPWNAYEFGFHILEVKANLVVLSMAWLTQEDSATFTPFTQEPDMETISYWIQRLEPVIRKGQKDEIIVVFCNRCGIEDDVVYAGTSAVVGIKNGEVSVYGLLGRGVKELLIVNTDRPPFAKLVGRSDTGGVAQADPSAVIPVPPAQASQVSPVVASPARVSPTKDKLGRLAEAEEPDDPPNSLLTSPTSSVASSRSHATSLPSSATAPMTQISPTRSMMSGTDRSPVHSQPTEGLHSVWKSPKVPLAGHMHQGIDDAEGFYTECRGNCSGCFEHPAGSLSDVSGELAPARPKLAISTGVKGQHGALQPGGFMAGRDVWTPPMTAFDDAPMTAIDDVPMSAIDGFQAHKNRYNRHHPPRFPPPSANIITPEEPMWPVIEGSPSANFKRTPTTPAHVSIPSPASQPDPSALSRSTSKASLNAPSRPTSWNNARPISNTEIQVGVKVESIPTTGGSDLDAGDVQALMAAVRGADFSELNAPPRPSSPKSRNASRDASRASSRNPSREQSRNGRRNTSRNGRCATRSPSRDRGRDKSRCTSRESSQTRQEEAASASFRRPLHSEPIQARGRARSSATPPPSLTRHSTLLNAAPNANLKKNRYSEGHIAAKGLLSSIKDSIPIAISPSALEPSFAQSGTSRMSAPPRPSTSLGHRRSRSASNTMASPTPQPSRLTTDFSAAWSSRPAKQHGSRSDIHSVASADSLQALMVPEDEAFLGRTLSRAETWRQKRVPRRTVSGDSAQSLRSSSMERVQPTFFF